jgi:hypothetical protein
MVLDAPAREGGGEPRLWTANDFARRIVQTWGFPWVDASEVPPPDHPDRQRKADAYSARLNAQDAARAVMSMLDPHPGEAEQRRRTRAASPAEPAAHSLQTLAPASDAVKPGDETK